MKKRFLSIFIAICLIFPSFFVVACKSKNNSKQQPYTYTVVLKNASDKIDETSLASAYDSSLDKNVGWKKDGENFELSVTKNSEFSDSLVIGLVEGYDYSNLKCKVNDLSRNFEIVSGETSGVGANASLTDRQLKYNINKITSDTKLVFDFSDCTWATINVNISELNTHLAEYAVIESNFVTHTNFSNINFNVARTNELQVPYGSVVAIVCDRDFIELTNSGLTKLAEAKYGSKYITKNYSGTSTDQRVQYLIAKTDCSICEYKARYDANKDTTIRILDCVDYVEIYNQFGDIENGLSYVRPVNETEKYAGENLGVKVLTGNQFYVEISSNDFLNYNYYLVDEIDEKIDDTNKLTAKQYNDTSRHYLEINFDESSSTTAKYLTRKAKSGSEYYLVNTKGLGNNAKIMNAEYILVGENNIDTNNVSVQYAFKKNSQVEVYINPVVEDIYTGVDLKATSVRVDIRDENQGWQKSFNDDSIGLEKTITFSCSDSANSSSRYILEFSYVKSQIKTDVVSIDKSNFALYENEKVFVTTDITNADSWRELDSSGNFELSTRNGQTLYYYFVSNRNDAGLQIIDSNDSNISSTDVLTDCFGRKLSGEVSVSGIKIDLGKVKYLEIKPCDNISSKGWLVRSFDETNHRLNSDTIADLDVMISFSLSSEESDFVSLSEIEYLEINNSSAIYYYLKSGYGFHLELTNQANETIGTSLDVFYEDGEGVMVGKNHLRKLVLDGGWYTEGEEFNIVKISGNYSLVDENSQSIPLFVDSTVSIEADVMVIGDTYHFVAEKNIIFQIYDKDGGVVIDHNNIKEVGEYREEADKSVYKFTLRLNDSYADGEEFVLKAFQVE